MVTLLASQEYVAGIRLTEITIDALARVKVAAIKRDLICFNAC